MISLAAHAAEPRPAPDTPPAIEPSRYAAAQIDEYLARINGLLHASSRAVDPFGLYQDPEAKPVIRKPIRSSAPAETQIPFSEIVPLIRITTIIAPEKKFLVESRVFSQGDEFPLNIRGRQFRILVTEVSAQQVEFKNLDTGEVAAHKLNLLPPGMTTGGAGSTPPGMISTSKDAPLILEPEAAPGTTVPAQ